MGGREMLLYDLDTHIYHITYMYSPACNSLEAIPLATSFPSSLLNAFSPCISPWGSLYSHLWRPSGFTASVGMGCTGGMGRMGGCDEVTGMGG